MAIGNPCEHRAGLVRTPERARQHLDRASWRNGRTIGAEREMASYTDAGSVPLVLGHWLFAASGVALPFSSHPATQRLVKRLRQSASTFFGDRMNRCPRCQSVDIVRSRIRMYERVYFWLTRKPVRTVRTCTPCVARLSLHAARTPGASLHHRVFGYRQIQIHDVVGAATAVHRFVEAATDVGSMSRDVARRPQMRFGERLQLGQVHRYGSNRITARQVGQANRWTSGSKT